MIFDTNTQSLDLDTYAEIVSDYECQILAHGKSPVTGLPCIIADMGHGDIAVLADCDWREYAGNRYLSCDEAGYLNEEDVERLRRCIAGESSFILAHGASF
jgi:hypothetical protein